MKVGIDWGGGMSDIEELYEEVPKRIIPHIASNF